MFLMSGKTARKLRKLRRRAWLVGLVLASGGLYWGARLALAHSRLPLRELPDTLPPCVSHASPDYQKWLPAPVATDVLNDPVLHAQEESCNQQGVYEQGADLVLQGADWTYSSLEGLQRKPVEGVAHSPEKFGWDGRTPEWALLAPPTVRQWLPEGLELAHEVRAVEARLWPEQHQGQLVFCLRSECQLSEADESPEKAWKHLPSAPLMGCLRKEVAQSVFRVRCGPAGRLLNPAERWLAVSLGKELEAGDRLSLWSEFQRGWIPSALWGDFAVSQVASARNVGLTRDAEGTLYTLGLPAAGGTSTRPWESWGQGDWVGAGRFHWKTTEALRRVEWVAQLKPGEVVVSFRWNDAAPDAESQVAVMGPDLETIYTFQPNVIAGR